MKPRLFFFHSNGFPAKTYGHFLKTLETWNPEAINILGADLSSLGSTMDPMFEEVISQVALAREETRLESAIHWEGVSVSWPRLRNRIYSRI